MAPQALHHTKHELQVHQIELKQQYEALQQLHGTLIDSHARYFNLYNLAPVGYCTLNENGLIMEANLCAATLLGTSQRALVGRKFSSFVFDQDSDACPLRQKLIEGREPQACELRMLRSEGTPFWAQLTISAVQNQRLVCICDVDERKQTEQALRSKEGGRGGSSGGAVTHTDITDSKEKLRALAVHQEELIEQERKHIAREVHDEMGQILTILGLSTSLIGLRFGNDPELMGMIEEMHAHIDNATKVVRRTASNLRPAALDLGLLPALDWLVEDFSRRWSIDCRLDISNDEIALDDLHSTAVFRVVQESLTNIVRHAKANAVNIMLRQDKQQLQLIVKDDGQGFDTADVGKNGGFGLLGMSERLLALDGTLHIESCPGKGTTVSIELPRL